MHNRTIGYWALATLGMAALLFLVSWLLFDGWRIGLGMMPGWLPGTYGFVWPAMMVMMLSMLMFWAAVILGIMWLARWVVEQARPGQSENVDLDRSETLRRRSARAENGREEYERLRQDLKPRA